MLSRSTRLLRPHRLHVERWGQVGPAVLLIHGLGGSGRYWRRMAEPLIGDIRLFAPDLLGFGRSPWPEMDYHIGDHLDALDAALADLGLAGEPIALAGHSLGANLALAWAARRPGRFGGLVLFGLPYYRSPEEARRHVARLSPLAYATVGRPRLGAAICGLMCFGRPFWRLVAPVLMPGIPADVARDGVLHTWRSYRRTLAHGILELDSGALARDVAASGLMVRLVHGSLDREAPAASILGLSRRTGWRLDMIPTAGHGLPIEQPGQCAEAIRRLIVGQARTTYPR